MLFEAVNEAFNDKKRNRDTEATLGKRRTDVFKSPRERSSSAMDHTILTSITILIIQFLGRSTVRNATCDIAPSLHM